MVDSNDVPIVDCELNETAKERVKNTYQNPNYRNPSSQKTKTAAIKSRGNLLSRGEQNTRMSRGDNNREWLQRIHIRIYS